MHDIFIPPKPRDKVRPIRPEEVVKEIPDAVIESFNELIALEINGCSAKISQKNVIARIRDKLERIKLEWLDVEDIYRVAGWKVTYYNPGYEPYFLFEKR